MRCCKNDFIMNRKKAISSIDNAKASKDTYFIENACSNYSVLNSLYSVKDYQQSYALYREQWNSAASSQGSKTRDKPMCVDLEVASVCDLACPFCYRQQVVTPDKLISEEIADKVLKSAIEMGIPSIKFNWRGEPLLNKKLEHYIKRAKDGGVIETLINTNALSLDEDRCRSLIRSGLDTLIYSFDGGTSQTYELNRPGRFNKNQFDLVVNNIKRFKGIRDSLGAKFPFTRIQMILTEESRDEVAEFYDIFSPYVDEVSTKQYTERGGNLNILKPRERALIETHARKMGQTESEIDFMIVNDDLYVASGRLPCQQPFQRLLVTYEGRVGMCCYDWGATYAVGAIDKQVALKAQKDYLSVQKNILAEKKSFTNMKPVIDQDFYALHSLPSDQDLGAIWNGEKIGNVRELHKEGRQSEVSICHKCKFKETYQWILLDN